MLRLTFLIRLTHKMSKPIDIPLDTTPKDSFEGRCPVEPPTNFDPQPQNESSDLLFDLELGPTDSVQNAPAGPQAVKEANRKLTELKYDQHKPPKWRVYVVEHGWPSS